MAGPTVSGKKRLFVALGGIAFIFILLIIRLFWIQIIDGKRLSEMAQEQQTQDTSLSAARGTITDTNGVVLAQIGYIGSGQRIRDEAGNQKELQRRVL